MTRIALPLLAALALSACATHREPVTYAETASAAARAADQVNGQGALTPQQAWDATPTVEPPRPTRERFLPPVVARPVPAQIPTDLPEGTHVKKLTSYGTFWLEKVHYKVDYQRAFEHVLVITEGAQVIVADLHGEILIEHTRPGPGVTYVGNGRPRGQRPKNHKPSPKS